MAIVSRRCIACACPDKNKCRKDSAASHDCGGFISWTDYYAREIALIERSLKNTYVQGFLLAVCLAAMGMLSYIAK